MSYSSKDADFAEKLEKDLSANSIKVWRDKSRLRGDQNWDDEIEKVLSDSDLTHVLVLLSPNSVSSEMVKNEIEYSRREGKNLVAVKIADCKIPLLMVRKNFVDFTQEYDNGYRSLLQTLTSYQPPISKITPPAPPSTPSLKLTTEQIMAAHDTRKLIRLIAAPGTGKSLVIEGRVHWLLSNGFEPKRLIVVSFTRAASRDLKDRIVKFCIKDGLNQVEEVSVTTLHSLALKVLRKAKKLNYPANPQVLDKWELEKIFDAEFSKTMRNTAAGLENLTPSRAEEVRQAWEAFWSTGKWDPPNYLHPKNPVTETERDALTKFHRPTTLVYSCVLPGEIIKMCVDGIEAGTLNPVSILGTEHLIIDEFQDLNYTDLQFIDAFIKAKVDTYVAGDDDQSIYSFRYAYPRGIQEFSDTYKSVTKIGEHSLGECFRCTPEILLSGQKLIEHYQTPQRLPKKVQSFCENFTPNLRGIVHRWIFKSENAEFTAIADSCKALIAQGMNPRNILILISNRKALLDGTPPLLQKTFDQMGVPIEILGSERYIDTQLGRIAYALLRIACDSDLQDYIAHRTILGLLAGVGLTTVNNIRNKVIANNLNYLDLFYNPLPSKIFNGRETKAIEQLRNICNELCNWQSSDIISDRSESIKHLIEENFDNVDVQDWSSYVKHLQNEMNLGELKAYLSADNSEQQETILEGVYHRLNLKIPDGGLLPQCVQLMTMHSAKGLNADVVFIPGLEEDILPGEKKAPYPGLVQEGARQVYVSITRARIACFISYATSRRDQGSRAYGRPASQYCTYLGGKFLYRDNGLNITEAEAVIKAKELYKMHLKTRLSQL